MVNPLNLSLANFKINKKVTVAANSEGTISVPVPGDAYSFIADIGYTKKLDTEYKLSTGKDFFNWGKNQVGSQTVPYLFNPPREIRGELVFIIKNNSLVSKDYAVSIGIQSTGTISAESDEGSVLPDISRFDERIKIEYGAVFQVGSVYSYTHAEQSVNGTTPTQVLTHVITADEVSDLVNDPRSPLTNKRITFRINAKTDDGVGGNVTLYNETTSTSLGTVPADYVSYTAVTFEESLGDTVNVGDEISIYLVGDNPSDVISVQANSWGHNRYLVYDKSPVEDLSGYFCDEIFVAASTTITLNSSSVYSESSDTTFKFTEPIILSSFEFESGDIIYAFKEA